MNTLHLPRLLIWTIGAALALPAQDAAQAQAPATPPADRAITDAIDDELWLDHAVSAQAVDVTVQDGIATLEGAADNVLARHRAAAIARTVKGVRAVINRIDVTPPAELSGNRLRQDVDAALLSDPATDAFEVDVAADDDGRVTLTGKVESWAERELCARVAKGVCGVTSLDNRLDVDYRTERPDTEIRADVTARLRWDTLVDDGGIEVACKDGKVALRGIVGSAAERVQARNDAWVAGVRDVDDSALRVERWARDDRLRKAKYAVRGDDEIRDAVQAALLQDPRVGSFDVATTAKAGIVTLRGTVDNLMARRAAAADARNTVGVVRVDNRLRVSPSLRRSAAATAQDVRDALARDPWVNRFDVTVTVRNGTAHLYGAVDSDFERARADLVASRIVGVVEVDNHLAVADGDLIVFDPYVDTWPIHGYGWYEYVPAVTFTPDDEIRDDVEDQLWWSPFVDSDRIDVAVDGGRVTLRGEVASRAERSAAVQNAYEGGATWVVDELRLTGGGARGGDQQSGGL
ncbi:MAG: BON domain-containing protein [Planctomycetota bacterium]